MKNILITCFVVFLIFAGFSFKTNGVDVCRESNIFSKKLYKEWREDSLGCKGKRAKLLKKFFPELSGVDRKNGKYIGYSKDKISKLFGKGEDFGGRYFEDSFSYNLNCKRILFVLCINFENNKVSSISLIIE